MSERSNGHSDGNLGTAVPAGDAAFDGLASLIRDMIVDELDQLRPRLADVTKVSGADARIGVRFWDDDGVGQELMARSAGVAYAVGDTVVAMPLGPNDVIIIGKVISSNADKAVVGRDEVKPDAIGEAQVADNSIVYTKLRRTGAQRAVDTEAVNDGAITAVKLSRAYATPESVDAATAGLASTNYVNDRIATRQPAGNYPTTGEMNTALNGKASTGHRHNTSDVRDTDRNRDLIDVLQSIENSIRCLNNNHGNKKKKPCNPNL